MMNAAAPDDELISLYFRFHPSSFFVPVEVIRASALCQREINEGVKQEKLLSLIHPSALSLHLFLDSLYGASLSS
jgi:hypothetical protein